MKKRILALVLGLMLLLGLSTVSMAANDNEKLIELEKSRGAHIFFSDETSYSCISRDDTRQIIDGYLNVYFEDQLKDPKFTIFAKEGLAALDLEIYPVLVMRARLSRVLTEEDGIAQIFFYTTEQGEVGAEDRSMKFSLEQTTDWQLIIVDLNDNTFFANKEYGGMLQNFRFDPCRQAAGGEVTLEIDWIAFFDNKEVLEGFDGDLEAVIDGPVATPTEQTGDATEAPTQAPTATPEVTKVPVDATRAPVAEKPADEEEGGCGSSAALCQVMLILAAAVVIRRKGR